MKDQESKEDPWSKLSPEERKRAERHLYILYAVMIAFAVLPILLFFLLK